MKAGIKTVSLFVFLIASYVAGLLIFTKGFMLVRTMIHQNSSCEADFATRSDDLLHGGHSGCWAHSRFQKAIVVVIDALRYDFLAYNDSLKVDIPPYKNRLKTVHALMNRYPLKTRLYKFMADPPTTTLQRLKALTTGSLPTFVDAGANFASSEITEDNWIDQLISQENEIKFLGDDTWESLFPNRFAQSHPFPSFNVKDLHTVDNGVLKHLYYETRRKNWDVIIAHFLGVDHCGHRFGPNHPAMAEKLDQMDQVIRNLTQLMKDDTVLFVFGDHGMTRTGDHGGDSEDELSAGLFVYSPAQLTASPPPPPDKPAEIQQVDLVPTISLLLGLPIPFSNLGSVIPDLFNHCPWWDTQHNEIRQVFHTVKALHLNALQVSQYITAYSKVSSDFPVEHFTALQTSLQQAEAELQALVTSVATGAGSHGLVDRLFRLQQHYQDYLSQVQSMCREVWAKFDLSAISLGLVTIFATVMVNVVMAVCWTGDEENLPAYSPFIIGGLVLQILYYILHVTVFPSSVPPLMGYVIGLVLVYALVIVLKKKAAENWQNITLCNIVDGSVVCGTVLVYCATFFSNSFVVYEDSVTHFLAQSLIWYAAMRVIINTVRSTDGASRDVGRLAKHRQPSYVDIFERLSHPAFVTVCIVSVCSILLRLTVYFRACREEQHNCELSLFLQALSAMIEEASGYKNQRYFFSLALLFLTLYLVRQWLQYYGNLNGDGFNVICTRFMPQVGGVACVLYWAVQALPQKELDSLPPWQQTIMAQIVYVCVAILIFAIIVQPAYIYIIQQEPDTVSVPRHGGPELAVPSVFRQLQLHWNKKDDSAPSPPSVYGLGSVYSSSLVCFCLAIYLLLVLVLGDGLSPSLSLAVFILFLCLELVSAYCWSSNPKSDAGLPQEPVAWLAVVIHGLLSSAFFFATGHQATIPNIRFESAFTGFHGDFTYHVIPALLIVINTFAAPIFFACTSLLLMFWPHLASPVSRWMAGSAGQGKEWKGEYLLFDNGVLLRNNLLNSCCRLLLFHAVKVLAAACAAGLHRRHLMVWKIFAPHFIFEAVCFIVVSVVLLIMMLLVLRIDVAVAKITQSLRPKEA